MRAVVDTNVWVSGIIVPRGSCARVIEAFRDGRFGLVTSLPLLQELPATLTKPRFARFAFDRAAVADLLESLAERADVVEVTGAVQGVRDPKDDVVVETAILGRAALIVTGDLDLLEADEALKLVWAAAGTQVVTVREFLAELRSAG